MRIRHTALVVLLSLGCGAEGAAESASESESESAAASASAAEAAATSEAESAAEAASESASESESAAASESASAMGFDAVEAAPCDGGGRRGCRLDGGGLRLSLDAAGRPSREVWPQRHLALLYDYDEVGALARVGLDADLDGEVDRVRVSGEARAGAVAEGPAPWPFRDCAGPEAARRGCEHRLVFYRGGGGYGVTRRRYDDGGREVERIEDTFANHRTMERLRREHDAEGRPIRETIERTHYTLEHTWTYDASGRCVREEEGPVGQAPRISIHRYDADGRRTRTVDEAGATLVERDYDAEGRLVSERRDGRGERDVLTLTYDAAGVLTRRTRSWDDGLHREVEHLDASGTVVRREFFEGRGRPRTVERFELDADGRVVASTRVERGVPGGRHTTTRYDAFGGVMAVERGAGGEPSCSVASRLCGLRYLSPDAPADEVALICARGCALLLTYEP